MKSAVRQGLIIIYGKTKYGEAYQLDPVRLKEITELIRRHYAARSEFVELPAGKLDKGEDPETCALRELEEEIGYRANKITFLAHIHPAIGFANELMSIFLAEDLEKTKDNQDKDEFLELIPTKLDVAVDLVWENKITDVKSIVGLLWLQKIKNGS